MFITNETHNNSMSNRVAKIIEIVGTSDKSWKSAADDALDKATKTLHGIHGIEVLDMTASVDPSSGKITNYRTCIKISLAID
jgi:flavin-binding protein dodecin